MLLTIFCLPPAQAAKLNKTSNPSRLPDNGLWQNVDFKKSPADVEIFPVSAEPIDNRRALLLVHGVRGELYKDCFRWQQLLDALSANEALTRQYKPYVARYNSYQPLAVSAKDFKPAVVRLWEETGKKPITVVALSIGGNVVAQSMLAPDVDACIDRLLTLGTPFHGSPLFTADWMDYSMQRWHKTPFTILDTCLAYDIYFSRHRNLLAGLNWDNSDRMLPDIGNYRLWYKPWQRRELSCGDENGPLLKVSDSGRLHKDKFITYAGYLVSGASRSRPPGPFVRAAQGPSWFLGTVTLMHLGKEHAVLRALNLHIAHAVIPPDRKQGTNGFAYALNDGITPVASSLFLDRKHMQSAAKLTDADAGAFGQWLDVRRARLFRNIDHLTFIDEYSPKGASKVLPDLLHPEQEGKTMFSWIAQDILDGGKTGEIAAGQVQH